MFSPINNVILRGNDIGREDGRIYFGRILIVEVENLGIFINQNTAFFGIF